MSEFLTLTSQLSTAVDQLNQVLQGDENTTVLINGEEKPSVQKKALDEVTARVQLVLDAAADIDVVKYATTAAGIAATTDGQFFSVVSSNAESYLNLYKNESNIAVFQKTYPSTAVFTQEVIEGETDKYPSNRAVYNHVNVAASDYILIDNSANGLRLSGAIDGDSFTYTWSNPLVVMNTSKPEGGFYHLIEPGSVTLPARGVAYLLKSELNLLNSGSTVTVNVGSWSDSVVNSTDCIVLAVRNKSVDLLDQYGLLKDTLVGYDLRDISNGKLDKVFCTSYSPSIDKDDIVIYENFRDAGNGLRIEWYHSIAVNRMGFFTDGYDVIIDTDETQKKVIELDSVNKTTAYIKKSEMTRGVGGGIEVYYCRFDDSVLNLDDTIILINKNETGVLAETSGILADYVKSFVNASNYNTITRQNEAYVCMSNTPTADGGDIIVTESADNNVIEVSWTHQVFLTKIASKENPDNYVFIESSGLEQKSITIGDSSSRSTAYVLKSDLGSQNTVAQVYYCRWNDPVLASDNALILINKNKGNSFGGCTGIFADYLKDLYYQNALKSTKNLSEQNQNDLVLANEKIPQLASSSDVTSLDMFNLGNAHKTYTPKKVGIITAGQSNTEGRVPLSTQPPSWYSSASPTLPNTKSWNNSNKTWGSWNVPGLWAYDTEVYKQISEYLNEDIYIIKRAQGGTAISEKASNSRNAWQPRGELIPEGYISLTLSFEEYIRNALQTAETENFEIKMFLWHQGESDAIKLETENDYYQNFKNVIAYVRGVVDNPKLPIVFGSISHTSGQYSSIVEDAQFKVASEDPDAYIVDMSNGTLLDAYHFDGVSSESLGIQMSSIIKNEILN